MSNDEFSSVEWLVEQIKKDINLRLRGFDIDKALPYGLEYLEKRQSAEDFSQQYYNETF